MNPGDPAPMPATKPHRKVPASRFVSQVCRPEDDTARPAASNCVRLPSSAPEVFGPPVWWALHSIAENYDPQTAAARASCAAWLDATPTMLPCRKCETHMQQFVDTHPSQAACTSRETLRAYYVDLHNAVNARTGGEAAWTPQQARAQYSTSELCEE